MTQVYGFRHRHALAGTAETDAPEHTPQPAPQVEQPPPSRLSSPRDLPSSPAWWPCSPSSPTPPSATPWLWENDPYWTYWITKTFLIATVFGLGTAWLGMGIGARNVFGTGVLFGLLVLALLAVRREETPVS